MNGGKSQRQICKEFTLRELNELLVKKYSVDYKRQDKFDFRHAYMMSMIAGIGGNEHPPSKYVPDWSGESSKPKMTQEEYTESQKNIMLGYFGIDKENNKIGKNLIAER